MLPAHNEVHCILQDSEGYIWFGTDNGVSRFDGYTFRNFGAREGLKDNVVFELLEGTAVLHLDEYHERY
ncbi:MAG: hypothetical protein H6560_20735 [Lewinellaceae bacterium]|nr:hypothetical protein [Lewinellaceae bacterium]